MTLEQIIETYTERKPLKIDGETYAYSVWLKIDQQSFQIGPALYEDLEEANWLCRQLGIALKRFHDSNRLQLDPPTGSETCQPSPESGPPCLTDTGAPDTQPEAALPVPPAMEASNPSAPSRGLNAQTDP